MGQTWGPPGSWRPQMGSMLAPWTLLSGRLSQGDQLSSAVQGKVKMHQHQLQLIWQWAGFSWTTMLKYWAWNLIGNMFYHEKNTARLLNNSVDGHVPFSITQPHSDRIICRMGAKIGATDWMSPGQSDRLLWVHSKIGMPQITIIFIQIVRQPQYTRVCIYAQRHISTTTDFINIRTANLPQKHTLHTPKGNDN